MINNEILSFVKDQITQGTTKDQIKNMLVTEGGWDEKDVEEAFQSINNPRGTSLLPVVKEAMVTGTTKTEDKTTTQQGGGFAYWPEVAKPVSKDVHVSPGLSQIEQPKSMEPSKPSFSPVETTPALQAKTELPKMVLEGSRVEAAPGNFTTKSILGDLRARIALGVSSTNGPDLATESPSMYSLGEKEPTTVVTTTPPSSLRSSVVAPTISKPIISVVPPSLPGSENSTLEIKSSLPQQAQKQAGSASSVFSFLAKTPTPAPSLEPQQSVATFPKSPLGTIIDHSHVSSNLGQFAPSPVVVQKQKGGRFLLGLMMLLVGLIIGGILMNAYMKGYLNGVTEKGMSLIGLGTVTIPSLTTTTDGTL